GQSRTSAKREVDMHRGFALVLAVLVGAFAHDLEAAISASQRTVLTNLYASTGGASWVNKTNWNGAAGTECTWFGITCDPAQTSVTAIILRQNLLVGTLPSLTALTGLQNIDLSNDNQAGTGTAQANNNRLSGSIPPLTGLTALQTVNLYNNQLTGSIPSLAGLTSLRVLSIWENQLSGTVPSLAGL